MNLSSRVASFAPAVSPPQGIREAVPLMSVGEQWSLEIPPSLAFGDKGRRASAGKPSIPKGATVFYDLLVESVPGRMEELIEITGDSFD